MKAVGDEEMDQGLESGLAAVVDPIIADCHTNFPPLLISSSTYSHPVADQTHSYPLGRLPFLVLITLYYY